jgi:single-strand DNA-binding protein
MSLPNVHAVGTLAGDPELRAIPSGAMVANFTVACNDRKKNESTGQWEDGSTTWLRCQAWRQLGENFAELAKGDRVWVTGKLREREFEKDGQKRRVQELDVQDGGLSVLFSPAKSQKAERRNGSAAGFGERRPTGPTPGAASDPWANTSTADADSIPF